MYTRTTGTSHSDPAAGPAPKCGNLQRDPWNWVKREATCTSLKNQHSRSDTREIQQWTRVYTDGSAAEAVKDGGSGIFIKYHSGNVKRISIPAGHTCTNCKAELLAIQTALDSLKDLELNKRNIALFAGLFACHARP